MSQSIGQNKLSKTSVKETGDLFEDVKEKVKKMNPGWFAQDVEENFKMTELMKFAKAIEEEEK